jgi:cytochrome c oxidase subunit III
VDDTLHASPAKTGVWVAVATIAMSFAAFTSAMVVRQSGATEWQLFRLPPILYLNTLLLIGSSVTLEISRRRAAAAGTAGLLPSPVRFWLTVTLGLGLLFVSGQVVAWRALAAQGLYLSSSPSSSFFYVLTAFHGLHLLGGAVGLSYVRHRVAGLPSGPARNLLGAGAIYWHFMGALWLYLLLILAIRA